MEYRCEDKKAYLRRQSAAIQSNCRIPVLTGLNCAEIQSKGGRNSGPYFIKPMRARKPIQVCQYQISSKTMEHKIYKYISRFVATWKMQVEAGLWFNVGSTVHSTLIEIGIRTSMVSVKIFAKTTGSIGLETNTFTCKTAVDITSRIFYSMVAI